MALTLEGLAARLDRLEQRAEQQTMSVIEFTTVTKTSADGTQDGAAVMDNPNANSDRQRPVRRMAPWGLAGRPKTGIFAAIIKALGGAFSGLQLGVASADFGPQNLDEGETCLYNSGAAQVYLDKNDNVTIKNNGASVLVKPDGTVWIGSASGLTQPLNGVVLAGGVDPFTGATYGVLGNASSLVLAKKA